MTLPTSREAFIAEITNVRADLVARLAGFENTLCGDYVIRIARGCYITRRKDGTMGGGFSVLHAAMMTEKAARAGVENLRNADGSPAKGEAVTIVAALKDEILSIDGMLETLKG
jgi:hypothetical protein